MIVMFVLAIEINFISREYKSVFIWSSFNILVVSSLYRELNKIFDMYS